MSGSERINEQPKVGPKGAAPKGRRKSKYFPERGDSGDAEGRTELLGGGEIGCRRRARRALRTGMRANQIARKFDEIVEFSGCARYIDTPVTQAAGLQLVESYGSERQPLGRLPRAA
jgi:hypothetical protein